MGEFWPVGFAVFALALLGVLVGLYRRLVQSVTVTEYQKGLKLVRGRIAGVVEPGPQRVWKPTTQILVFDARPKLEKIAGQEVLTSDVIPVRLSLTAEIVVSDVQKAFLGVAGSGIYRIGASFPVELSLEGVYETLHNAIREAVGRRTIDEVLAQRNEIATEISEAAKTSVVDQGFSLNTLTLRDITLPGEYKKAMSQVTLARQEGLATLERARGEAAAMRSLANTAKMLEENPNLSTLRTLQLLEKVGGTLVISSEKAKLPLL